MAAKKIVVLDGCGLPDQDLAPVLDVLLHSLRRDGSALEIFPLREMKLAHCVGCFNCWLKTPGICVEDDANRRIARAVVQSDTTVFFTPVTFGGYSAELKKMLEHFIQIISPFFQVVHGEVHHPPRYARRPRLVMIGVQRQANPHEARIFKVLAGRNAINFLPPSCAADVVLATDPVDTLEATFEGLLTRSDVLPFGERAAALMPAPVRSDFPADPNRPKRALLIVGSPKTSPPITSSILGGYLLERLAGRGWETESTTLRAGLNRPEGEAALLHSVRRAGLILLVFPLYGDSLPHLVIRALSAIAADRRAAGPRPQQLVAIVNSGFPETLQNAAALAISQEFASQTGITWAGGLALGGGGTIGAEPLTVTGKRSGLPVKHIVRALDLTADALADGRPVPAEAVRLMARHPIPWMPFALYRWIYTHFGGKGFAQMAARNGVAAERLLDQPYAV